jgi:hypothetical protein
MVVDLAALFAELAEGQGEDCGGYSTEEISAKTGVCEAKVRKLVRQAIANGSCEAVTRKIKTISGHWTSKPAYRFKLEVAE